MLVEIAAIILVYATTKPVRWLLVLALLSELFTTLPFGTLAAVAFLPMIAKRFFKRAWIPAVITLQIVIRLGIMWSYGK